MRRIEKTKNLRAKTGDRLETTQLDTVKQWKLLNCPCNEILLTVGQKEVGPGVAENFECQSR